MNFNPITNETPLIHNQRSANPFPLGSRFSAVVLGHTAQNTLMEIINGPRFETQFAFTPNIGDILEFEVVNTGKNFALKLLNNPVHSAVNNINHKDMKELFKQSNFTQTAEEDEPADLSKALGQVRARLAAAENTGLAAVNQLMAMGIPLSQIDVGYIETYIQSIEPSLPAVDELTEPHIHKTLNRYKLPLTDENIGAVQKAIDMFNQSHGLSDSSIALALSEDKLTMGGVYKAKFSGKKEPVNAPMTGFKKELLKLFSNENIPPTEANIENAKLLYGYNLPITAENIQKINTLKNLDQNLYAVMDKAAQGIYENISAKDISLNNLPDKNLINTYNQTLESLPDLTGGHVDAVVSQNQEPTLANLRTVEPVYPEGITPQNIVYKRQLAEIQLKLTSEAAYRLADKNINIDVIPLKEALEELRALEREYYQKTYITNAGDNIQKIFDAMRNIRSPLPKVYSGIIRRESPFTLEGMNSVQTVEKRLLGYEPFMTVPNSKYGDGFDKVQAKLAPFVEKLGMPSNEENIRLASILSRTNMDINYDNMMQIKVLNQKIEYVLENFHPKIAARLIKENVNPLTLHMDELTAYIDGFNNQYGSGVKDRLNQHILDVEHILTPEERAKMMAIYKTLNQVNQFGGAALGINMRMGNTLTLGHLLDASDYFKKTGANVNYLDVPADGQRKISADNIRALLAKTYQHPTESNAERLKQILNRSEATPAEINEHIYTEGLLKEASVKLSPEILQKAPFEEPISTVLPEIDNLKEKSVSRASKFLEEMAKDPLAVHFLEKSNIKASLPNIQAMAALLQPKQIRDKILAVSEDLNNRLDIPEDASDYISEDDLSLNTRPVERTLEQMVFGDIPVKDIRFLQNAFDLQSRIGLGSYSLPIKIKGAVTALNMYVQGRIDDELTVAVSLGEPVDTDAFIKTQGKNLSLYIKSSDITENSFPDIIKIFAEKGFTITDLIINEEPTITQDPPGEYSPVTRRDLFNMATCLTKAIA